VPNFKKCANVNEYNATTLNRAVTYSELTVAITDNNNHLPPASFFSPVGDRKQAIL